MEPEIVFKEDLHDEDCMCDECIKLQSDLESGKKIVISTNNLKCCGNCKNANENDGGTLQCSFEEHISDYNGATSPSGVCDKWEFDNLKNRKQFIVNSCEETTLKGVKC